MDLAADKVGAGRVLGGRTDGQGGADGWMHGLAGICGPTCQLAEGGCVQCAHLKRDFLGGEAL